MDALMMAGLVLTLLLLSVMLGKRKKLRADKFLIFYLVASVLGEGYGFLERTEWMQHSYWMLLGRGLYLIYSPLFFMYVYALTHEGHVPRWLFGVAVAPLLAYIVHFFYYYGWVFDNHTLEVKSGLLYINGVVSWSWLLFVVLMIVIEPIYLIWFYRVLRSYRLRILDSVSNTDRIHLNWVRVLFYLHLLIVILLVPVSLLALGQNKVSMNFFQMTIEITSLFFFFVLGYYGFNQTTVFANVEVKSPDPIKSVGYERSGLSDEQAAQHHRQLLAIMKEKRPYLNGELSAQELAQLVGISTHQLSQVLNTIQQESYFDFVNRYRVDEVKARLQNKDYAHLTLLGIALDSGFNSKTSFNTIFKKFTGQTPSQFQKTLTNA
jgi:AraC-like DNA-binding protein